jgi:signal transduction histidine kinase
MSSIAYPIAQSGSYGDLANLTRLEALAASVAHEVNQPLAGIIVNANTCLRMLAADPPNVAGALETARRTIRDGVRANDVVKRLCSLFSTCEATTELIDLNEATREAIARTWSDLQRERVNVRLKLAENLPLVEGDRILLQQVILNLILNAMDAMTNINDRVRHMTIGTERGLRGGVCLTVQDSGVGIEPNQAERLFDAFYSTKSAGRGIGLFISRTIIESHHGQLSVAPNDGPGATFTLWIPFQSSDLAECRNTCLDKRDAVND